MPIIIKKCPNCGTYVDYDSNLDTVICPNCGSKVFEKAINCEDINNNAITDDVVNCNDDDFVIDDGVLVEYIGTSTNIVIPDDVSKTNKAERAFAMGFVCCILPLVLMALSIYYDSEFFADCIIPCVLLSIWQFMRFLYYII